MNAYLKNNTSEVVSVSSKSLPNFNVTPLCVNVNPYGMSNDDWIPKHIWIAPRTWYTFLAIYMTLLTISCCFLNGVVVAVTKKYKVSAPPCAK